MRDNILATLAYYDVFDFPLKAEEILAYLINFKYSKDSGGIKIEYIKKNLDQLISDRIIGLQDNFYFLFDREYIVPLRLKREIIARHKWQIALGIIGWLKCLPYLRTIFASGSLAMNNTNELSDLDVLIIVKHGRIWLSRFLILVTLSLLGRRRKGTDLIAPDKICASHFIADNSLGIPMKGIYNAQIYGNLVPIYTDNQKLIENFKNENIWILDHLHSFNIRGVPMLKKGLSRFLSKTAELILDTKIGDWLENLARDYQAKRIAQNPITAQAGDRVIFNDNQLMFRINSAIFKTRPTSLEDQTLENYRERLLKLELTL